MSKEHPILFQTEMVKSVLADSKTMTRRTTGLKMFNNNPDEWEFDSLAVNHKGELHAFFTSKTSLKGGFYTAKFPYGKVGDILWVRETWRKYFVADKEGFFDFSNPTIDFAADSPERLPQQDGDGFQMYNSDGTEKVVPWKPSIFMPKTACRILLQITCIKVERLQDISEGDILNEGVRIPVNGIGTGRVLLRLGEDNSALSFLPEGCLLPDAPKLTQQQLLFAHWAELWCDINGRESWDSNPFVWCIEFKRIEKPNNWNTPAADTKEVGK